MSTQDEQKRKKTFPLEIEDNLHKALKHKAIESDMSLHAFIIDALASRVREDSAEYTATSPKNDEQIGKP